MHDNGTAVITASRYPHGYASVRSLAKSGVDTIAAVADDRLAVTASRYCDETVTIPPSSELPAYTNALLNIAKRPDVDTIVPHRPQDPYILAKHYDELAQHVDLVAPSLDTLRRVHDRMQLMEAAEDAGVPVPETRLLDEVEDWDEDRIVKARYNLLVDEYVDSFGSDDSRVPKLVEHVSADSPPDSDTIRKKMQHTPIVQEYVDGDDEYVFGALYDHGEALATFQHRQLREDSYTGGGGVYRETVDVPALETVGRTILDHLDWHGLACIEYIRDSNTGEFKLVEINPRMWQSLPCATRAGANFPYWYWLAATGRADTIEPGYDTGVRTHYLQGELQHLVSIAGEDSSLVGRPSLPARTSEILVSCLEHPNFDYLHLDDPRPIVRQARTRAIQAIKRRTGR
jgi:predicted ATP-grasp superfamily ATP-dependent carboligase